MRNKTAKKIDGFCKHLRPYGKKIAHRSDRRKAHGETRETPTTHRQIESLPYQAICGQENVQTTLDWRKVDCRDCLDAKHNYVGES